MVTMNKAPSEWDVTFNFKKIGDEMGSVEYRVVAYSEISAMVRACHQLHGDRQLQMTELIDWEIKKCESI